MFTEIKQENDYFKEFFFKAKAVIIKQISFQIFLKYFVNWLNNYMLNRYENIVNKLKCFQKPLSNFFEKIYYLYIIKCIY